MTSAPSPGRPKSPRQWRPRAAIAAAVLLLGLSALALGAPDLSCPAPLVSEASPDKRWTLTVCPQGRWFAMPGSSGDAPALVVLRDAEGGVRGVTHLSMVQLWGGSGMETQWTPQSVSRPLVSEMALAPASGPLGRWIDDRIWRLRALFGLTTTDDAFR